MKKKELEIFLQKVPKFPNPNPSFEQYLTPADIAADIIYNAHFFEDIEEKTIIDLGCGTGIFAVGASITGAKSVYGIDIDPKCIKIAESYSKEINLDIKYITQDVSDMDILCDTVIMNPPFGAQKSNSKADRKFIEKSIKIADIVYSLHLSKTLPFLKKIIESLNGNISYSKEYSFPIPWMFEFHEKQKVNYDVILLRIETENR
jgi:putative methylase